MATCAQVAKFWDQAGVPGIEGFSSYESGGSYSTPRVSKVVTGRVSKAEEQTQVNIAGMHSCHENDKNPSTDGCRSH